MAKLSKVSSTDADMARDLHNWAVNTMHFVPRPGAQMPVAEDFKYICRGQMNAIWRQVMTHVHSTQYVRKVKGNLMLKRLLEKKGTADKVVDEVQNDLNVQRQTLLSEIKTAMSTVLLLEKDVERLRAEIATTESSYQAALNQLQDVNRKRGLLRAFSKSTTEEIERIDDLTGRVRQNLQRLGELKKKASEAPVMLSRTVPSADGTSSATCLETSCAKAVRECCEIINSFLHRLLEGAFEGDDSAMSRSKEELWRHVDGVASNYPASHILAALCEYADSSSNCLREKMEAIDIHKEVEQLRFKFENGGQLSDLSTSPTVFQTVNQILESRQAAMFQKFLETEKCKNESFRLHKRLAEASSAVDDILRRHYDNPEALQLARNLVETETRLASARAAVSTLNSVSEELSTKIVQATADKDLLYAKYQKIQDFKKIAEMKQNLIRVLVKQNMNSHTKLTTHQSENVQYVEKSLKGQDIQLQKMVGQLKDCVSVEVGSFTRLQLPLLPIITIHSVHKRAIADLSINKLSHVPFVNCRQLMSKLLSVLQMPPYIAPECVLPGVAQLQTEGEKTLLILKLHRNLDGNNDITKRMEQLHELCDAVRQHDKEQTDKILPVLQQRLMQGTQTLSDCLEVKDIATYWWEQPAQYCVPWITVDGLNLKQWHDKYTVIATRLRQMPEN